MLKQKKFTLYLLTISSLGRRELSLNTLKNTNNLPSLKNLSPVINLTYFNKEKIYLNEMFTRRMLILYCLANFTIDLGVLFTINKDKYTFNAWHNVFSATLVTHIVISLSAIKLDYFTYRVLFQVVGNGSVLMMSLIGFLEFIPLDYSTTFFLLLLIPTGIMNVILILPRHQREVISINIKNLIEELQQEKGKEETLLINSL